MSKLTFFSNFLHKQHSSGAKDYFTNRQRILRIKIKEFLCIFWCMNISFCSTYEFLFKVWYTMYEFLFNVSLRDMTKPHNFFVQCRLAWREKESIAWFGYSGSHMWLAWESLHQTQHIGLKILTRIKPRITY